MRRPGQKTENTEQERGKNATTASRTGVARPRAPSRAAAIPEVPIGDASETQRGLVDQSSARAAAERGCPFVVGLLEVVAEAVAARKSSEVGPGLRS